MNQLTVSLWGDEAFASILAQKNVLEIITTVARDTSPPLHYLLLHFWMQFFGRSEIAIRALPLLLFFLLVYVVYRLTWSLLGKKTAYLAALLTLFNPFLFLYAFEARMYMLLALTTAASMWFLVSRRWLFYVLATTAALYTHHFSIFVVLVQFVYHLFSGAGTVSWKKFWTIPFIRSLGIVFLLYLPWLPALYGQTTMVKGDFWLPRPTLEDLWQLYSHFIAGSTNLPIESLILIAAFSLLILRGFKKHPDSLFYLWLLLPGVLTYFFSQLGRPIFFDRYLIISAPAIPFLLASQTKRVAQQLLVALVLALTFINFHSFQNPTKQPFRELARFVNTTYSHDKVVVNYYTEALHYFELKHYGVNVKIYSPSGPLPFWVGTALIDKNDILTELPKDQILLVVISGNPQKVQISTYQLVRQRQFGNLSLLWFISPSLL